MVGFWDPKKMLNLYKTFLIMQRLYDGTFVYVDMVHLKSHRPRLKQKNVHFVFLKNYMKLHCNFLESFILHIDYS